MNKPITLEEWKENSERVQKLILKKYTKTDPLGNGLGLTSSEAAELAQRQAWQRQTLMMLEDWFKKHCMLKKGDFVEATFEDGTVYARISEEFNGAVYHIQTLEGGGGCTIKPEKVRQLSAVEVFTLGFSK